MPPLRPPTRVAAELKELAPDAMQQYTVRVSTALSQKIVASAARSGNQISREIGSCLAEYFAALDHGVVLSFDPVLLRRLDTIAECLGLDRGQVVRTLIGEGLAKMLQRAIDLKAEADELARKLDPDPGATPKKSRTTAGG